MFAMAEGEDHAPAGRVSGGEKLAEWEIKAPRVSTPCGDDPPQVPTAEPSAGSLRLMTGTSLGSVS